MSSDGTGRRYWTIGRSQHRNIAFYQMTAMPARRSGNLV